MPSLDQFATRMKQRALEIERGAGKLVRETALVANQAVIAATPVDTGRARANWLASLQNPVEEATDNVDPSGSETIAANASTIENQKPGESIYLSNNLPYIESLNQGSSAQAPAGFVEQAVQTAVAYVRKKRLLR